MRDVKKCRVYRIAFPRDRVRTQHTGCGLWVCNFKVLSDWLWCESDWLVPQPVKYFEYYEVRMVLPLIIQVQGLL